MARLKMQLSNNESMGFIAAYRIFANADADLSDRLGEIKAKTLVMTGEQDVGSTPAMSRSIAGRIPGAQLGVAPGMRHLMILEASKPVCQAILTFLRR
jgi:pimeloyl-ACP methyl ester carboxylesterase